MTRNPSPFLEDARFVLNELTYFRVPLVLRAMPYTCWKCSRVNSVPWMVHTEHWSPDATQHQNDPNMLTSDHSLAYITEFLAEASGGDTELTSTVKPRYSRTMRGTYMSHGCINCDSLFGQYPLFDHWFNDHVMRWDSAGGPLSPDEALAELPVLATTTRPYLEWLALSTYNQAQISELIAQTQRETEMERNK